MMRASGFSFAYCCFSAIVATTCFAGPPRDEVLRLVPDDVGICLLVQDLRGQAERLQQSPFAERLASSPIGRSFRNAPESRHLAALDQQLTTTLHLTWAQLRDDVLGDAIAVAYTPGPPNHPEREQGLLILYAHKPDRLATLIDRLNELQKQAGELVSIEKRDFSGWTYYCRTKREGAEYYALRGPLLVFSDSEARLRLALECDRQRPPADRTIPRHSQTLRTLGVEKNLLTFWVNPRTFDAALDQKQSLARGPEAEALQMFAAWWKAIDAAAVTVRLEQDISIGIAVQTRPEALPPAMRALLKESQIPPAVWSAFPNDALLAAAGRISRESANQASTLSPQSRKRLQEILERGIGAVLGQDILAQVLSQMGPEWGLCVAPPERDGKTWLPSLTAVVQLHAGGDGPVEKRVLDGLDFFVRLTVISLNSPPGIRWQIRHVRQGKVDVRVIDAGSWLPPGLQPAFAWKGGFLIFASSPDAVQRFHPPPNTELPATTEEIPVVRLALAGWASYLRQYREPIAQFVADSHKLSLADVHGRLDRLLEAVDLFDTVELMRRTVGGRMTLTLRMRMAAPLAK